MRRSEPAVLLFDLDNTLVDRDGAFGRYLDDLLARHPQVFADAARARQDILALDAHGHMPRAPFCAAVLQRYPALPYSAESLWQDHLHILDFVERRDDVIAMLGRLARRHPIALLSNGSGMMQRHKLARAGLAAFFAQPWISGELGVAKPDPQIFRLARAGLGDGPTVMIGDDLVRDIAPAQALGYATLHICPHASAPHHGEGLSDEAVADLTLSDILQVEEALTCLT